MKFLEVTVMYLDKETLTKLSENIKELIAAGEISLFKIHNARDNVIFVLRLNSTLFYSLDKDGQAVAKLDSSSINEESLERVYFTTEAKNVLKLNVNFQTVMPIHSTMVIGT